MHATQDNCFQVIRAGEKWKYSCPACGRTRRKFWDKKNSYELIECSICGVIFTSAQGKDGVVKDLYEHYYDGRGFAIPPVVGASLNRLVISLERFRRTGRWLDVGFGQGGVLAIAQAHGWTCFGTELSPPALAYGEQRGWTVTSNSQFDPRFTSQGFDVISMVEVLEHLPEPDEVLKSAARLLRPGGVLYLTTPNAESLNRKILGAKWTIFSPPEHLTVWTARGLRRLLSRHGFATYQIHTDGLNPAEILQHVKLRHSGKSLSRNDSALALNEAFSSSRYRLAVKTGINRFLSVFRLGDGLKAWAVRVRPSK